MNLKILADRNIPYVHKLFGVCNDIRICAGRFISFKDLINTDVLIVRSVTKVNQELLSDSSLKFVGTATAGVDHIDQFFLRENGIAFTSAPGSNAVGVVEYVLTVLFYLAQYNNFFLRDKVIGVIGVGHIGSLLYQRLNDFGVHTLLCDPFVSKMCVQDSNNNWRSLEELISEADILTFHTPLTDTGNYPTWHMVNIDVLDALPTDTIIINTCRGAVFDNNALLKVLQDGKRLSVVLDVWESEPELSMPLLSSINIGTPHIAGHTVESKIRGVIHIYRVYCKYFNVFNNSAYEQCLLSVPRMGCIKIKNKIDEVGLFKLIHYIYDVRYDDFMFKRWMFKLGKFDVFRERYVSRREWGSLCIEVCSDYNYEILTSLGFNVKFV